MTSADPLAHERFRTIARDAFRSEFDRVYGDGRQMDADAIAGALAAEFSEAHFEYRTNEAGVRLRKVVVESAWEVDLTLASATGMTDGEALEWLTDGELRVAPAPVPGAVRLDAPWHA